VTGPARKLVVFGTGSFAEVLAFYFTVDSQYEVVAFTATRDAVTANTFCARALVPFDVVAEAYPPSEHQMFVAVGYSRLNRVRARFYTEARALGYELATYVSSKATHWGDTVIGDNCAVLEGTTIEPFVRIGNDVVLWSGSHVGHHSSVGDHCFIASDVVIPGSIAIGDYCFAGVNATFRDGITVGERCLIGAGATIMSSTRPRGVYLGPRTAAYSGDTSRFLEE
jgi:sugar O-acyltransferase (sialic acid O-acetyltransferase NeuD family)